MNTSKLLASAGIAAMLITAPAAFAADIAFSTDTSYPESLTYSAGQNLFFLGSVTQGIVAKLDQSGAYSPFIEDDRLVTTVGLLVDDANETLWVTNSDPGAGARTAAATQGKLAAVASFDARTGAPKAYYDLASLSPGAHFANDIAVDAEGNAYVTDSFAPIIYKIDTSGVASIFAEDPAFFTGEGFNLNGIAWHPDGFLLVGKYNTGDLFRISTTDPKTIEPVVLPEALIGADGIHLVDAEHLVVVQNLGADRTVELVSTDGWKTAGIGRTEASELSMPTAAVRTDDGIYVLNARLDTLFDPNAPKVSDYLLQQF